MSTIRVNNMTNIGGTGPTYAKGMVIQTVTNQATVTVATTATTYTSFGFSVAITPKSVNSRILVFISGPRVGSGSTSAYAAMATVFRGASAGDLATNLAGTSSMAHQPLYAVAGNTGVYVATSSHFVDTPATTSTVYYTAAYRSEGSAATMYFDGPVKITVQEIAA